MATDYTKIQQTSAASSNKVLIQGSGTFIVPALPGAGNTFGSVTIPHGFINDTLLWQVTIFGTTVGNLIDRTVLPWQSNDGRRVAYATIDVTNLTIICISSDVSGLGNPSFAVNYTYRVLVP